MRPSEQAVKRVLMVGSQGLSHSPWSLLLVWGSGNFSFRLVHNANCALLPTKCVSNLEPLKLLQVL